MTTQPASSPRSAGRTRPATGAGSVGCWVPPIPAARRRPSMAWTGAPWRVHPGRIHWRASRPRTCCARGPTGSRASIELTGATRVGEGITGTIRVRATKAIQARAAGIRLVGMLIAEEQRSQTRTSTGSDGHTSSTTESWVEVHGQTIEDLTFTEPFLPPALEPGQAIEVPFSIPAPRLGPPSAHAGSALVAWAVEAHWDIHMGSDERVAVIVPVGPASGPAAGRRPATAGGSHVRLGHR